MSNYTPGPWEAFKDNDANCVATVSAGWTVLSTKADPNKHSCESDARLIAAAPEMLEALRAILAASLPVDKYANGMDAVEKAISAINKARGMPDKTGKT